MKRNTRWYLSAAAAGALLAGDREDHDERGAMIRAMARARAGDVLLWLLLFGAAYLYFFGVPKWVSLILLTLACVKLLLDWMFTVWYRRQY